MAKSETRETLFIAIACIFSLGIIALGTYWVLIKDRLERPSGPSSTESVERSLNTTSSTSPEPETPEPEATADALDARSLTIGILGSDKYYASLKDYLSSRFGRDVQITVAGDENTSYQEAKNNLAAKKWDIAFTLSPMISVAAQDNGYEWAARMFASYPPYYQSALFVRADSPIRSLADLTPSTKIALGDFNSASSFYMPSYDLYGQKLQVDMGHRGGDIRQMVESGAVDVGAGAYGETIKQDPNFRIIHLSRNIPGSGVYLSPDLSTSDRRVITEALLNAPEAVRQDANYGDDSPPDYSNFLDIVRRVEQILSCANFSQNPVQFYCNEQVITGRVNGLTQLDQKTIRLSMMGSNGKPYQVLVSPQTLNQIPNAGSAISLQNKSVQIRDVTPKDIGGGKQQIEITSPQQLEVSTN